MQFKPRKAKPMSQETRELGSQFVKALLLEGHAYDSVKANFLALLSQGAVEAANTKLAKNPPVVRETSGMVRGSMGEAAKILGMSRYGFSKLFHGAEGMAAR
jgi:hypothetical protein